MTAPRIAAADAPPRLVDSFGRAITYIRLSVTDRCNFRCVYCMAEKMTFLPHAEVLRLEELDRLCSIFVDLGVKKIRLTGGEPLVRRGVMNLVHSLSRRLRAHELDELTLTTNGSQLARYADELAACGVKRVNVSLDTLDPAQFAAISRHGALSDVLAGIEAADRAGLKVKINAVAQKGITEDCAVPLIRWAHGRGYDVTFIEVMPLGDVEGAWTQRFMPLAELRANLAEPSVAAADALSQQRPGALLAGRGDRRTHRLHHADDAQLLRQLQPRADHLLGPDVSLPRQ